MQNIEQRDSEMTASLHGHRREHILETHGCAQHKAQTYSPETESTDTFTRVLNYPETQQKVMKRLKTGPESTSVRKFEQLSLWKFQLCSCRLRTQWSADTFVHPLSQSPVGF